MKSYKVSSDSNFLPDNNHGLDVTLPTPLPFEVPEKFINIPNEVINHVSTYLPIVIKVGTNRDIPVANILENTKMILKNDGIKHNDIFWKQHCVSSFRELIDFLSPEHFRNAFSSIPKESVDPKVEIIFSYLEKSLSYLSSIVHFRESSKLGDYDKLYSGQGYGTMNIKDFLEKEDVYIEKVFIHIIYALNQLFCDYCIGNQT